MNGEHIKFLVDVGVGRKVESWLVENGYDTKAVRDKNPRMADREILRIAAAETRMIITILPEAAAASRQWKGFRYRLFDKRKSEGRSETAVSFLISCRTTFIST